MDNETEKLVPLGSDALFGSWTPITERMPKSGRKVIVCGHYSNGNPWRAMARWQPAGTIDAEMWDEYPDDWEDEDGDRITNPHDLWLEESAELEQTGFLENVTHWMPLPILPNAIGLATQPAPQMPEKHK